MIGVSIGSAILVTFAASLCGLNAYRKRIQLNRRIFELEAKQMKQQHTVASLEQAQQTQELQVKQLESELTQTTNLLEHTCSTLKAHRQLEEKVTQLRLAEQSARLELELLKEQYQERIHTLQTNLTTQAAQFEELAERVLHKTELKIHERQRGQLEQVLHPFEQHLSALKQHIQEAFSVEARERHTLKHTISELQNLNQQLATQAIQLTNALKGNNKIQGTWGELILDRALALSGLRSGVEYSLQKTYTHTDGRTYRPDVIVHLPGDRSVIIDAKLSLTAYERYFNSEELSEKKSALQNHVESLKQHIKLLGSKAYQTIPALKTVDYVLLFIPVEPALSVALEADHALLQLSSSMQVMLVTPSTLLIALRTIENLWKQEKQQQNASLIAERAGQLYDKFYLLIQTMQKLGGSLLKTQQYYDQAVSRLSQGRGNLVHQMERLRHLGLPVARPIDASLAEQAAQAHGLCTNTLSLNNDLVETEVSSSQSAASP